MITKALAACGPFDRLGSLHGERQVRPAHMWDFQWAPGGARPVNPGPVKVSGSVRSAGGASP
jgi:hypothetical protein